MCRKGRVVMGAMAQDEGDLGEGHGAVNGVDAAVRGYVKTAEHIVRAAEREKVLHLDTAGAVEQE